MAKSWLQIQIKYEDLFDIFASFFNLKFLGYFPLPYLKMMEADKYLASNILKNKRVENLTGFLIGLKKRPDKK